MRGSARVGKGQRETETQNPKQALGCQDRTRQGARTREPGDRDLSQSPTLNRLSHPGAPVLVFQTLFTIIFKNSSIANIQCYIVSDVPHHPVLITTSALLNPHVLSPPSPTTSPLVTSGFFSVVKSLFLGLSLPVCFVS